MSLQWQKQPTENGVVFTLHRRGLLRQNKAVSVADWPGDREMPGVGLLRHWLDRERATSDGQAVTVPHAEVAALSEAQARELDLPPVLPHALSLNSHGTLDQADFDISLRWLRHGTVKERLVRRGALGHVGETWYRLPKTLFDVAKAVDTFRSADTRERADRLAAWAPIQDALERATGERVRPDGYLADLQILHAGAFSLSVDMRADDIGFEPVLFGRHRHADGRRESDNEEVDDEEAGGHGVDDLADEGEALLPRDAHETFVNKRFGPDTETRWAYPLQRNQYVVLDEPLRQALDVVKEKQRAPTAEKREFVRNPRAAIAERLGLPANSPDAVGLFVETEQYADRVKGIQLWEPKVLPWMPKGGSSWMPEKLGLQIGGKVVELEPERVGELRRRYDEAVQAQESSFGFDEADAIPVSAETDSAIGYLESVAEQLTPTSPDESGGYGGAASGARGGQPRRHVIQIDDNLEELSYQLGLTPRRPHAPLSPPGRLIDPNKLLAHQQEGFAWLVRSWRLGRPGVLLADDMGLGKTLQALAFAAWLDEHHQRAPSQRGPILIVAPTALLKTWRAEHDKHLDGGGLGPPRELYGSGLKQVRTGHTRDIDAGGAALDREELRRASWILTTYETLANYHFSFAAIPYAFVIFDEIQKIKTPTTINTHAAKTLNAEFTLGLTGTPVENRLTDLWSIMDRLHPGLLGDLHTFTQTYQADDLASLQTLHRVMTDDSHGTPVMLRRMKDNVDLGKALPPRETRELPADMPETQARAYEDLLREARESGANRKSMLSVLHKMRGTSLHPRDPGEVLGLTASYDAYVQESARLQQAIAALDGVYRQGEKALVYIETRDMQELVTDILRVRYGLAQTPRVINGQTPSARRQAHVDAFQNAGAGFDVMVLAPRAAGVGLTLTAANHVIHLSRWWNPAVEDQCNDRVYRIGQDKPVTVYCPMARHPAIGEQSFDLKLHALLQRKREMSQGLLVPQETESDYAALFEAATRESA